MAKNITIDIIDKEYDDTYIPSTAMYDNNNVPNQSFTSAFYGSNIGLAGCSFNSNPVSYNISGANGVPSSTTLKPFAYDSTQPPGAGFCSIFYRDTPMPTTSANQANFPGTAGPSTQEFVGDYDFSEDHSTYNGWANPPMVLNSYLNPAGTMISSFGLTGTPNPNNPGRSWYGWYTICSGSGSFAFLRPTSNVPPEMNYPGNNPSFHNLRLGGGTTSTCSNGSGGTSKCGIYQLIQGLTPGQEYTLKIRLAQADTAGHSYLSLGWSGGAGISYGGQTYNVLGGASANIYGTAPGALNGGNNTNSPLTNGHFKPNITTEQSATFIAQGGNEILWIEYYNKNGTTSPSPTGPITFDYISIMETGAGSMNFNWSGFYAKVDLFDANSLVVPGIAKLRINVGAIDTSINGDCIVVGLNSVQGGNLTGAVGLNNIVQSEIRISNNPLLQPTNPLSLGMNTISFFTNTANSTGSFAANDRLLDVSVINKSGTTIKLNSVDVRFTSYTTPVTTQLINYDKSVIGTLEVSNSEDFPLDISYTVSDGKSLDKRFGDYSKSFDLPATKRNNKIFNQIWKANVDQSEKTTYGIKDCRINVDGTPFFDGKIQIKKSAHAGKAKSYTCTIYGGNFSWMSELKDKGLCEVYDEADEFMYDFPTIESTWLKDQSQTDIQFPLISYRDFNRGGLQNYINTFDTGRPPDFQAAFYVYNMLQKIFKNIGYKIDSSFINSDHFKRLITTFPFLKNDAKDNRVHFSCTQQRQSGDWQSVHDNVGLGTLNTWHTCILNHNVNDPSSSYDNGTGVWTCQMAGTYDVTAEMGYRIILRSSGGDCANSTGTCYWEFLPGNPADMWTWASRVKVVAGGQTIYGNTTSNGFQHPVFEGLDWVEKGCWDTSIEDTIVPSFSVTLGVGDTIELQGQVVGQNLTGCEPDVDVDFGFNGVTASLGNRQPRMTITYNDSVPQLGGLVEKNNILPCGISQVDFIKAISHLFNLYFTTDVQSKTVYIEPFNDFYKNKSEGIDWTTKVDLSQDIKDEYNIGLKSELRVGYKKDSGDKYAESLNYKSNIYGDTNRLYDYNEVLGEDYESGTLELINPLFASSTQVWDNDAHDDSTVTKAPVLIPNVWSEDCYNGIGLGNNQYRPVDLVEGYVPRIFYYCWENPVNYTTIPNGLVANAAGTQTYWSRIFSNGSAFANQTVYPRATFVDWEERIHTATLRPSLSFSDEAFEAPGQFQTNPVPGLYTVYYKNMIEQLKQAPRIRTVYVNLKMKDILNLDMRKLIYLDEAWWRINKIDGYSPAKNQPTKVELIQWLEVGHWPVYVNNIKIEYS
tara:strand:- start:9357 stop:13298 length:3942 start_codon:yes stop_codon:yes gene_type:complete